jgi:DUF1365 family protein
MTPALPSAISPARARRVALPGGLCFSTVFHKRLRPKVNAFRYGVFYLCVSLRDIDRLRRPLFSLDRFNLLSFHHKDHGSRSSGDLESWMRDLLHEHGLDAADGDIVLHCHPRILGYVFNPISLWFCHDRAGMLRAVLCEVNNTFGERHLYLIAHDDARAIQPADWLQARKVFHVSPFLPVEGFYRFRFRLDAAGVRADIHYHDGSGPMLLTYVAGTRRTLTSRALLWALIRHPLMTFTVMVRIHYQAVKLLSKKARFFRKPEPPAISITR